MCKVGQERIFPVLACAQVWRFPDVEIIIQQSVLTLLIPLLLERIYGTVCISSCKQMIVIKCRQNSFFRSIDYFARCRMTFFPEHFNIASVHIHTVLQEMYNSSFPVNQTIGCSCCHLKACATERCAHVSSHAKCYRLRHNFCHRHGSNQTTVYSLFPSMLQ